MSRKTKDNIIKFIIYLATAVTVGVLVFILGYIFINGIGLVNWEFLTRHFDDQTSYIEVTKEDTELTFDEDELEDHIYYYSTFETPISDPIYVESLGAAIMKVNYVNHTTHYDQFIFTYISDDSPLKDAVSNSGEAYTVKEDYILKTVDGEKIDESMEIEEVVALLESSPDNVELKVVNPGGGIFTNIITTLYMIGLALLISVPIGIFSAIYLNEYAKPGKLLGIIRFATESLAGIPSIIFGLFGMAFFVVALHFQISLLAGSCTVAIIVLPVIIRSTEEALKAVPNSYREGSYGLGASKIQTIFKIILPSAMPGIVVAIILSVGRIIGESAALLLTAGTAAQIPNGLFSPGSTLTVQAYYVAKEEANLELACAIGIVIIVLVVILNLTAKLISKRINKANY
jgi:phosphate transport system permease protein